MLALAAGGRGAVIDIMNNIHDVYGCSGHTECFDVELILDHLDDRPKVTLFTVTRRRNIVTDT